MSHNVETLQKRILEKAKADLLAFCLFHNEKFETPAHIVEIARVLHKVEKGELKRVIITIPPRHGKSMLCSQYFPAFFLSRNPEKYIITATYGQELADDFGRFVRNLLTDSKNKLLFPESSLRSDSTSASRFNTEKNGSYFSVGAGGAITGRGADLLVLDDLVKNREVADSAHQRRKIYEWYQSVAYTRLMPNASVFVISTRWHKNDLVGTLLEENKHENWLHIDMPAIDEHENPLWPERYSLSDLTRIKQTIGEYAFQSLYQQKPISRETSVFKDDWLLEQDQFCDAPDCKLTFVDPAISQASDADQTAIVTIGINQKHGRIYDIDVKRGRWTFEEIKAHCVSVYERHRPDFFFVENVQAQDWLVQDLIDKHKLTVLRYKPDVDKVRKAYSVQSYFEQKLVHIKDKELRYQLMDFTQTDHDDIADAFVSALVCARNVSSMQFGTVQDTKSVGWWNTEKGLTKNLHTPEYIYKYF